LPNATYVWRYDEALLFKKFALEYVSGDVRILFYSVPSLTDKYLSQWVNMGPAESLVGRALGQELRRMDVGVCTR